MTSSVIILSGPVCWADRREFEKDGYKVSAMYCTEMRSWCLQRNYEVERGASSSIPWVARCRFSPWADSQGFRHFCLY